VVPWRSAAEVHDCADRFAARVPAALWRELRATGLLPPDAPVPAEEPP
jgi:D-threo-aldose 1-dehydrogenase